MYVNGAVDGVWDIHRSADGGFVTVYIGTNGRGVIYGTSAN